MRQLVPRIRSYIIRLELLEPGEKSRVDVAHSSEVGQDLTPAILPGASPRALSLNPWCIGDSPRLGSLVRCLAMAKRPSMFLAKNCNWDQRLHDDRPHIANIRNGG